MFHSWQIFRLTKSTFSYLALMWTFFLIIIVGEFQDMNQASTCELCFFGTYADVLGTSLCTPCPVRIKSQDSTLFLAIKDCRQCFFSPLGVYQEDKEINRCCKNISTAFLPLNFSFTETVFNLSDVGIQDLETAANNAIEQFTGDIPNLIRLEENLAGWSRGIQDRMSLTLYIQYAGFQIQGWSQAASDPKIIGNFSVDIVPWDTLLGFDQFEETVILSNSLQPSEISAEFQFFPSYGPTNCTSKSDALCVFKSQTKVCTISCFCPYFAIGTYSPASLSTNR